MAKGKTFPLKITVSAFDKSRDVIRNFTSRIRSAKSSLKKFGESAIRASRSEPFDRLRSSMVRVRLSAMSMVGSMRSIAYSTGLSARAVGDLISSGDDLAKKADRIGISVDAFAQLRFAAQQSGTEMGRFDSAMEGFAKRVGETSSHQHLQRNHFR